MAGEKVQAIKECIIERKDKIVAIVEEKRVKDFQKRKAIGRTKKTVRGSNSL